MKIAIILGTRPEIIKLSPVIRECEKRNIPFFIIHSNQHYDQNMDEIFFQELKLPEAKYNLNVGSDTRENQLKKIKEQSIEILKIEQPNVVIVQGDTNTVLAGAQAAKELNIKIAHVEAGLRSYDMDMPEEINRIETDKISDYLFPPTEKSKSILINEGYVNVYVTGNTIVDAVYQNKDFINVKDKLKEQYNKYAVLTLHRPSNVDNPEHFQNILNKLSRIELPIIWPIHPRAKKNIASLKVSENIKIVEPYAYHEFLNAMSGAEIILTDSGGIQEEACILKVPCVTLRKNTERPETLEVGSNILALDNIKEAVDIMIKKEKNWKNPYGDGTAAKQIIDIINENN